jgi:hypothetical protein
MLHLGYSSRRKNGRHIPGHAWLQVMQHMFERLKWHTGALLYSVSSIIKVVERSVSEHLQLLFVKEVSDETKVC